MHVTERFSDTVPFYTQYRPQYPDDLFNYLQEQEILKKDFVVADIGAGTGIFSKALLQYPIKLLAVEPNEPMLKAAINELQQYQNFNAILASAEKTTLADASIDLITVATAFHWFDRKACKKEFLRILKPSGKVLLVWNLRLPFLSPICAGYEDILKKYCPDYKGIPSQQIAEQEFISFFAKDKVKVKIFANQQVFDLQSFIGRLRSTSYSLKESDENYVSMIKALESLFNQYQKNGAIIFPYQTKMYLGELS